MSALPLARSLRSPPNGFTYLWLLFAIAIGAATAAAIGARTSVVVQREKEAELAYRGADIARAISSYWRATPGSVKALPRRLDDLLEDRRNGTLVRHMRRVWSDPFTGEADWHLVMDKDGTGLLGVRSSSPARAFDIRGLPATTGRRDRLVSERAFAFTPPRQAPPPPPPTDAAP